ncbi:Telomerase protein component 1 [Blastocladiella emersonii ATCC 22665]|nr:Telomerase protein component 1 [Blastocladiella emersonii ATCC 22665]
MLNPIRTAVSRKKRRYKADGFDLDLAYITDRIIAMGFPSENMEGLYRNPMTEVVRFLDAKHRDSFKVYNLCSEKSYDPQKFHGRVAHYPFDDHNAPPFNLILPFCEDVKQWLDASKDNVAVVHCKAGKGRTGVMICAYLLYSGFSGTPEGAMYFYGNARTSDGQGVTIPSQVRYIKYWHHLLHQKDPYTERALVLTAVDLARAPRGAHVSLAAYSRGLKYTLLTDVVLAAEGADEDVVHLPLPDPVRLAGDVRLQFVLREPDRFAAKDRAFHFWLNTAFVHPPVASVAKPELDKLHKDKHHRLVDAEFRVDLHFAPIPLAGTSTSVPEGLNRLAVGAPATATGGSAPATVTPGSLGMEKSSSGLGLDRLKRMWSDRIQRVPSASAPASAAATPAVAGSPAGHASSFGEEQPPPPAADAGSRASSGTSLAVPPPATTAAGERLAGGDTGSDVDEEEEEEEDESDDEEECSDIVCCAPTAPPIAAPIPTDPVPTAKQPAEHAAAPAALSTTAAESLPAGDAGAARPSEAGT